MKMSLRLFPAFLLVIFSLTDCIDSTPFSQIVYEENSLYQYIRVEEDLISGERLLYSSGRRDIRQGGIRIKDPDRLIFEYSRMAFTSLAFLEAEPARVLFVGLGAGSMPRFFARHYPDAAIDIVEIDPAILKVARKFFHFKENTGMKVHLMDGRMFMKKTRTRYDMIFLDAYRGQQIPFHLTTVQFLEGVRSHLNEGGVVVSNILSEANNRYFWSMVKTYREGFGSLFIFRGKWSGNHIFVAPKNRIAFDAESFLERARRIQSGKGMDIDLALSPWEYGDDRRLMEAKLLTDDFAPVNLFRHREVHK